ncbi:MAG: dnaG [Candidatus Saccharibacteria bacterium]|nr:dnaG [Candidatus Saccharibacteria bacterium]MDB5180356.1 dnaG [Candidatus Saccharibacteria bacterium]
MQDAKEEVRSRLNIEDVVGEYVQLKRAGRNFKGLSPFSGEKTPSFYVSPEKNIWHDFSSNKGGDVFSFIMEVEGVDFREALELLARRAGIELSDYDSSGNQEFAKMKRRLLEAHRWASLYYQESLKQNDRALQYVFKQRGLSKEIVQTFQIGYAPDSGDALVQFLTKKGFTKQELSVGGLTNRFGGDLFRGRMMVPLMDPSGQVIGFTGRILKDEPNAPKYLNTPQSPLYDKSRHVFGLSQAKEAIRKNDYTVVVEGNLDVVSSHQVGIKQVVATAGTAMTEPHLKALVRLSPNVRLAYDGDAAGLAATERSIPIAQNVGTELTIISLPEDVKDPDELIQKDVKLWQKAIDDAEGVVDWLLTQYTKRENMAIPLGMRRFTTAALTVVRALQDPVEQEFYLKKIAGYTSTTLETVREKFDSNDDVETKPALKEVKYSGDTVVDEYSYQDNLLALGLLYPEVRELFAEIDGLMLSNDDRRTVLSFLKTSSEPVQTTPKDLQIVDTYVKILLLKADARYGDWSDQDRYFETARLVRIIVTKHKQTQKDELTAALRIAEDEGKDEEALRLRHSLNELIKEIPHAKR